MWDDEQLEEGSGYKSCFTHDLCQAWEAEAQRAREFGVRVVLLRIGLVLGIEGGILARMLTPFEFCLGGPLGSGRQWMSWISRDDLVRLIGHAMVKETVAGRLNATAPYPVTNADFTKALAQALGRPAWLRAPAFLLRLIGGGLADELLLGGQRVLPQRAFASGFAFQHETIEQALKDLLGGDATRLRARLDAERRLPLQTP